MTQPDQVFDYDMRSRERHLLKTQEVPSGHEPNPLRLAPAHGPVARRRAVPVSMLYREDTPLDGTRPACSTATGPMGSPFRRSSAPTGLSLVDRGFVYAIAHVRGGKDKGYGWYEDGKREKKENTFHDFIAAGRHLVRKVTRHDRIVAQGGSAGGMLMGAVANMAPGTSRRSWRRCPSWTC